MEGANKHRKNKEGGNRKRKGWRIGEGRGSKGRRDGGEVKAEVGREGEMVVGR